jgi:hypothetical protein
LTVFAYRDSLVQYNGKPLVSPHGGTWYRSHRMMRELGEKFNLKMIRSDSLQIWESKNRQLAFFLKENPDNLILHTIQVERNGFIHSLLYRTEEENKGYEYYGARSYGQLLHD